MNIICDELVYVMSGNSKLVRPSGAVNLSSGDTALIEAGDKFCREKKRPHGIYSVHA
jgi:uncharacterized cupin superfamily protein